MMCIVKVVFVVVNINFSCLGFGDGVFCVYLVC